MISIARTFGAPESVPAGSGRPEHVDRSLSLGESPGDLRGEVHDVAVALDHHPLLDHLGAEAHHAADVVAREVDQHHVLCQLLRVLDQLSLEPQVVGLGLPPRPRSGDRPRGDRSLP